MFGGSDFTSCRNQAVETISNANAFFLLDDETRGNKAKTNNEKTERRTKVHCLEKEIDRETNCERSEGALVLLLVVVWQLLKKRQADYTYEYQQK